MTGIIIIGTAVTLTIGSFAFYTLRLAQKRQEAMLQKAHARRRR